MVIDAAVAIVERNGHRGPVKGLSLLQACAELIQRDEAIAATKPVELTLQHPLADQVLRDGVPLMHHDVFHHAVVAEHEWDVPAHHVSEQAVCAAPSQDASQTGSYDVSYHHS